MSELKLSYQKKHTIRDVASHAGVSVATVSHVINGTHYVSPELTERVLEAIHVLDYHPNKVARALTTRVSPLLALIVPDISNPFWSRVTRAIQDVTDKHGYSVIVCNSDGLVKREVRFICSLSGWISGLILHPYHMTHDLLIQTVGGTLPVVILGSLRTSRVEQPGSWDWVSSNNRESARIIVEHLIGLGHRRIAFIQGSKGTPSNRNRLRGYQDAHERARIPVFRELIVPGDYTRDGGRRAMSSLLGIQDPPTAVFCANDLSALGALEVAKLMNCRIPEDISIVGYDDIDEAAHTSPPLTTVRDSPREVGTIVAETLVERLKGRKEPVRIDLRGSLVIRESSGPPPQRRYPT
jgi:LacI family transcriptional regulator